jgi:hypothetical protein
VDCAIVSSPLIPLFVVNLMDIVQVPPYFSSALSEQHDTGGSDVISPVGLKCGSILARTLNRRPQICLTLLCKVIKGLTCFFHCIVSLPYSCRCSINVWVGEITLGLEPRDGSSSILAVCGEQSLVIAEKSLVCVVTHEGCGWVLKENRPCGGPRSCQGQA